MYSAVTAAVSVNGFYQHEALPAAGWQGAWRVCSHRRRTVQW